MAEEFLSVADDFFVNLNLQTVLDLPSSRETVLSFLEVVQKEFPDFAHFYHREEGEFILEGDHERGTYPWLEIQKNRLTAGYFNPPSLEKAYHQHRRILERCKYYLGMGGLDLECLDVLFGFNLTYNGNRDAVVAQALLNGSPLSALAGEPGAKALEFQPDFVISWLFTTPSVAASQRFSTRYFNPSANPNPLSVFRKYASCSSLFVSESPGFLQSR